MLTKILSLALLILIDGLRRHAIIGLILLALLLETGGLLFFDFIPRDIGRASADFVLSVGWLTGFLFLFFHAVQVMAWDEERRTIHTILARPISRSQYVLGVFFGLAFLLFLLNSILALLGYGILKLIKDSVDPSYFPLLSIGHYLISWAGLYCIQLTILSVILLFSGLVRGGFPVLLLSISYYFICTGLPVVRDSLQQLTGDASRHKLARILRWLTAVFPDFGRFDFKALITREHVRPFIHYFSTDILLMLAYIAVILWCASIVYQRRDLQ
jgi:ABC-type transport system involved in multi-copper enzyme maturation permease subunit